MSREQDAREAIARLKSELVAVNGVADRARRDMHQAMERGREIQAQIREWSKHIPPTQEELCHCHAGRDGECGWVHCPQHRDGEPAKTGRSCPLPWGDFEA